MPIRNPSGMIGVDDGTFITISYADTKLYRIRKSDGQMQLSAGVDTDTTL